MQVKFSWGNSISLQKKRINPAGQEFGGANFINLPKRQAAKLSLHPEGQSDFFQLVNNNFNLHWFIILAFLVF